jgi:hypothetical protein
MRSCNNILFHSFELGEMPAFLQDHNRPHLAHINLWWTFWYNAMTCCFARSLTNWAHLGYKKSYKTENIFLFNKAYSNEWQSKYVSSDSSIQSQIIVHKIPIISDIFIISSNIHAACSRLDMVEKLLIWH